MNPASLSSNQWETCSLTLMGVSSTIPLSLNYLCFPPLSLSRFCLNHSPVSGVEGETKGRSQSLRSCLRHSLQVLILWERKETLVSSSCFSLFILLFLLILVHPCIFFAQRIWGTRKRERKAREGGAVRSMKTARRPPLLFLKKRQSNEDISACFWCCGW